MPVRFMLDSRAAAGWSPAGTEIASPRTAGSESVVFQTAGELVVPHECKLATYGIQRKGAKTQLADGGASARAAAGAVRQPRHPPAMRSCSALTRRSPDSSSGWASSARAPRASADPGDPPLQWEASVGGGEWEPAAVVADETGGFMLGGGAITVQVPEAAAEARLDGVSRHWLRCRVRARGHGDATTGRYTTSPEISVRARRSSPARRSRPTTPPP